MLNQKGFSTLIFLSAVVVLAAVIIVGSLVIKKSLLKDLNSSSNSQPQKTSIIFNSPSPSPQTSIIPSNTQPPDVENDPDLTKIYSEVVKKSRLKECHYFDNCYQDIFTAKIKLLVARKYGVAISASNDIDISIGLLKGSSVDIPGIGTGYLENKQKLNIQADEWYWEIGACSTNNRIFVNAVSGQAGPLHKFVYCGGVP